MKRSGSLPCVAQGGNATGSEPEGIDFLGAPEMQMELSGVTSPSISSIAFGKKWSGWVSLSEEDLHPSIYR